MQRYRIFLAILLVSSIISCSSQPTDYDVSDSTISPSEESTGLSPRPDYPAPSHAGVYIKRDTGYVAVDTGDPKFLHPTNASRSFGFAEPVGTMVAHEANVFAVLNAGIDPRFLQITEMHAVATPVQDWSAPIDNSNVAWIPYRSVPSDIKLYDLNERYAEIVPSQPLSPGFYVIHDDSFLTGRNRTDVSAYYPFTVTDERKNLPWIQDATRCFRTIFDKYGSKPSLRTPPTDELSSIQKCALAQRIAWKITSKAEQQRMALDRILYLSRLAAPSDPSVRLKMHNAMDPAGDQMANVFYQIHSGDDLIHIAQLYQQSEAGMPLDKELVREVMRQQGIEDPSGNITDLTWWPFLMLSDADRAALKPLFEGILAGNWQTALIATIGAIKLKQITERATEQTWVAQLTEQLPRAIKDLAGQLKLRDKKDKVIYGPFKFEHLGTNQDDSELKSIIDTIKKQDITSCIGGNGIRRNVVLILNQPLDGTGTELTPNTTGVLKDPLAQENTLPVITPEAVHCILKTFTRIPGSPSLDNNRSLIMAITIVK